MTVNHPVWGTMCEICFKALTKAECAYGVATEDPHARPAFYDVCAGECARQAGIAEVYGPTHNHITRDIKPPGQCPMCDWFTHVAERVTDDNAEVLQRLADDDGR